MADKGTPTPLLVKVRGARQVTAHPSGHACDLLMRSVAGYNAALATLLPGDQQVKLHVNQAVVHRQIRQKTECVGDGRDTARFRCLGHIQKLNDLSFMIAEKRKIGA